jgi:hypothetical protein
MIVIKVGKVDHVLNQQQWLEVAGSWMGPKVGSDTIQGASYLCQKLSPDSLVFSAVT